LSSSIVAQKRDLRAAVLAARAALTPGDRATRSRAIAARLVALPQLGASRTVALYAPLGTEVDALELAALLDPSRPVYPRCASGGDRRLEFARCAPAALVKGPLGAREPPPGCAAVPLAELDCVVVPGLAFSLDGHRLGRGGGYYDATLEASPRAFRIGVAFEVQLVPAVPREAHDAPLDAIATESRLLIFERPRAAATPATPGSP
jgi:5-formyltetrahydrofolate cyclo-ligase